MVKNTCFFTSILIIIPSLWFLWYTLTPREPIKIGILHSLTGTMAISEPPVVDATLLAIEEINNNGGVLGKKLLPLVADGKSDWPTFAKEAERLITQEKVDVIFGCWTSASRKEVKPVVEKYNHLLFYPVQYEGLEESPNIVYTGAAPNQQIIPGVQWALNNLGTMLFLKFLSSFINCFKFLYHTVPYLRPNSTVLIDFLTHFVRYIS